jgi:hypothetical protein
MSHSMKRVGLRRGRAELIAFSAFWGSFVVFKGVKRGYNDVYVHTPYMTLHK